MSTSGDFSIEELAERAGIPTRTVRYYVTEGLIPGPLGRGRQARYTAGHLARLLLIRRLVDQRVPLAVQSRYLAGLSDAEIGTLLGKEEREANELHAMEAVPSPRDYVAKLLGRAQDVRRPALRDMAQEAPRAARPSDETWQRVKLAPGIELHVRTDAAIREQPLIEEIKAAVRAYKGRRS